MESYVDFISRLIYGTGVESVVTPNHRDWLSSPLSPSGIEQTISPHSQSSRKQG